MSPLIENIEILKISTLCYLIKMQNDSAIKDFHPIRNPLVRMNGICPYFTMYPLTFPYSKLFGKDKKIRVLDPFCGRGTTNFAARLLEMESVGIDSNPVAVAVTQAKFADATFNEVIEACEIAIHECKAVEIPTGDFWATCYHPTTLEEICKIRSYFLNRDIFSDAQKTLRAIILGLLHGPLTKGKPTYLSNQMPRTYSTKPVSAVAFWKSKNMKPFYVSVRGAVRRRAEYVLKNLPRPNGGFAVFGDSRNSKTFKDLGEFDMVVTSPPYLGMRSYWPDQWLRNWFMGGPEYVEYTQPEQIQSQAKETFIKDLGTVWKNTSMVCKEKASMIIRFGALPSYEADPGQIIKESLIESKSGWSITTIKSAGLVSAGKRQAEQFNDKNGIPVDEIDVYCVLNNN